MDHPAVVRFVSCEPLPGALNLGVWIRNGGLHWVIAGGESGPRARPMNPVWAQALRDQCARDGVAFHFKQWGHWYPTEQNRLGTRTLVLKDDHGNDLQLVAAGKKAAGRHLDGRCWDQFPQIPRN